MIILDSQAQNALSSAPKGQLLTPAQGCGISTVARKRIVGGSPAKPGSWPWLALLGYKDGQKITLGCGKHIEFSSTKIFEKRTNLE